MHARPESHGLIRFGSTNKANLQLPYVNLILFCHFGKVIYEICVPADTVPIDKREKA
jgi:hypothetical protein